MHLTELKGMFELSLGASNPTSVPIDGAGDLEWFRHRSALRANQLFALYTFLVSSVMAKASAALVCAESDD